MYHNVGISGLAIGAGSTAASAPFLGMQAIWIGLATFTLVSACLAVGRILPKRKTDPASDIGYAD